MTEPRDDKNARDVGADDVGAGDVGAVDVSAGDVSAASLLASSRATPSADMAAPSDSKDEVVAASPRTTRSGDSAPNEFIAAGELIAAGKVGSADEVIAADEVITAGGVVSADELVAASGVVSADEVVAPDPSRTTVSTETTGLAQPDQADEGDAPGAPGSTDIASNPEPEIAAGHEPAPNDSGDAARALADEADAARAAVQEASKPVERYPTPDARAQRLAGFGCMALMLLLTVGFAVVFRIAFRRITSLDTNLNGYEVETVAPNEARRRPRDSAQPSTRTASEASGVEWRTDLAAAFEEARREGRPLLLHFEAGWATASRDMLDGTYANVAVREALASFVPLRIDLTEREPDEQELAQRFVVTALPHVVYLAPDGERLRPDSTTLVDASDMEIFLREALGAYEDGRRFTEPTSEPPPAP